MNYLLTLKNLKLTRVIYDSFISYPAPLNFSIFWNFGFLAFFFLFVQILTGVFLAMHYTPNIDYAFISIEHIMRDVNYGWLVRYLHSNGASMFFIIVYVHLFRGLYYGSYLYPRQNVWFSGVIMLLLMILTAFLGYVLPWGQMSFWGATVITNLCSAIPFVGTEIVYWLWGGFSVDNPTLNRFFSFHFVFPFVIMAMSFIHVFFLHLVGSNNPLGINFSSGVSIPFDPYYIIKDLFGLFCFFIFWFFFVYFSPNSLGHPDNYVPANPLVTPPHIVPEWYFLPFYAILRAIPDKFFGVVALLASILVLLFLPFLNFSFVRSSRFKLLSQIWFWNFLIICVFLGWLGSKPVEYPFYFFSQCFMFLYFSLLVVFLPFISIIENFVILGLVNHPHGEHELYAVARHDMYLAYINRVFKIIIK